MPTRWLSFFLTLKILKWPAIKIYFQSVRIQDVPPKFRDTLRMRMGGNTTVKQKSICISPKLGDNLCRGHMGPKIRCED